jgi:hypothetical protein
MQTSPSKVAKKIQLISLTQAKAGKNLQGDGVRVFSVMHIYENSERECAKGKKRARLFTRLRLARAMKISALV